PSASTILWTTTIDCGFHMKASFGSRRLTRDRSVPEMFSIESILLGSGESKGAIGHLDVRLDPKRTCFSIMSIWLETTSMDVMTGVYCCSPRTHPYRRAEVLRRFLFMARQAAAEHTKGNLILFASPGMAHQSCHFDEILQAIASVDLNMAEECYIAEGGCFITFNSPLSTFRLDDIRALDIALAVRKNLLKLDKLFLEKQKYDALGQPPNDILLSTVSEPLEVRMMAKAEEIPAISIQKATSPDEDVTAWRTGHFISATNRPSKMNLHTSAGSQMRDSFIHVDNVDNMNNVIPICVSPNVEKFDNIYSLNSKQDIAAVGEINGMRNSPPKLKMSQKSGTVDKKENMPRSGKNLASERYDNDFFDKPSNETLRSASQTLEKDGKRHVALPKRNSPRISHRSKTSDATRFNSLRGDVACVTRKIPSGSQRRTIATPASLSLTTNNDDKNNKTNRVELQNNNLKQLSKGRGRIVRISTATKAKTAILKEKSCTDERKKPTGVRIMKNELKEDSLVASHF
uniref:Uncharacterized protein n=1 Tax=Parascaris univalens TaxID=6257 RepID=A0A915BVI1_PARUN